MIARSPERPPRLRWTGAREVALRILATRYAQDDGSDDERAAEPVFDLARFQADAVKRAEAILAARRGVLIADSVGLGKTFVALALAERSLRRGERVVVVTPAALRRDWRRQLRRLARTLDLPATAGLGWPGGPAPPALAWLSHARLSRGTHRPGRIGRPDRVVVDEAHAFRTPHTRRYRALAALCRGAGVVLLTATPVNNTILDVYHLIRLFAGDADFQDLGVASLREAFRSAAGRAAWTAPEGAAVRVLRAVTIRRTRPFLREHYRGVRLPGREDTLSFPRRAPPTPVRYTLDAVRPGFARELSTAVERLSFAPFRWHEYGPAPPAPDGGAAGLLRLLLLKRLESSVAAFRASVARQARYCRAFLDAHARGRLLTPDDHRVLYGDPGDTDAIQLVMGEVALRPVPPGLDTARLGADARRELTRLERLAGEAAVVDDAGDPKARRLRELVTGELAGSRVVVFTEYRDTARHLWRALRHVRPTALVDGTGAFLGAEPCGRREVVRRFAPRANGVPPPPERDRVELLVATDVLAEGLNLHDANRVVSYDLPWNPVRLIQRIGRVDRLGSPFDTVHSYHFLPDEAVDGGLALLARLRGKLAAIGRTVGTEAPVLGGGDGEGPSFHAFVDRLAAGDPDVLDEVERAEALPFELDERLRILYTRHVRHGPGGPRPTARASGPEDGGRYDGVPAAVVAAEPAARHRVLVACTVDRRPVWLTLGPDGSDATDDEAVAGRILLRALEAEDRGPPPPGTPPEPSLDAALSAARAAVAARLATHRAAAPLRPSHPATRVARRLLEALASVPGEPPPALCRRVDTALDRLSRPPPAGAERALRALLRDPPDGTGTAAVDAWLDALRRILPTAPTPPGGAAADPAPGADARVRLVGVIECRPPP